jgi:hypothetical protein
MEIKNENTDEMIKIDIVQRDGKDFLEIPEDILNKMGWSMEDNLIWDELEDGRWGIKKVDE